MTSLQSTTPCFQSGFSKFGLFLLWIVLVIGLMFTWKILPVYLDHYFVKSTVEDLVPRGRTANFTQVAVLDEIVGGLRVESVSQLNLNSITLRREIASPVLDIDYERRGPFVANSDVSVSLDERVD
jgi:hypothetical protein